MGLIKLTVEQDYTTLDLLLWRRFGFEVPKLVERTLARNGDIAEAGAYLPVGTVVEVETDDAAQPKRIEIIRLWN